MSIPSQSISVTDLDFDQIKSNLIQYFKSKDSPFKDWDYSGSGLNTLIDVLAHNTHYNAILAHMAVNESFIDTAQIRANVVSAAKLIGYTPNSYSAATASINVSAISDTTDATITIDRGTIFNSLSDSSYEFVSLDDIVLYRNELEPNRFINLEPVKIYQGYIETRRIQLNDQQSKNQYIIEDKNIDISTLKVLIYDINRNNNPTVYLPFTEVKDINGESPIYFIYENYNGNYVLSFGNGIFGKKPDNLNILEISYVVTSGPEANGIRDFRSFRTSSGASVEISVIDAAYGGSYSESISSIKFNAPLNFISQNRAVTADDYEVIIKRNFQEAESVCVWGGEENEPPQYGKVFISVKKKDSTDVLSQTEKNKITEILKSKKVLTILPEIIDAEYIDIVLDVLFKYNANLTRYSKSQLENYIRQEISYFNDSHLNRFDGIFRHSFLSRTIDQSEPSILNSLIRVYISKKFTIDAQAPRVITLNYGTELTIDDDIGIAKSSPYVYRNTTLFIGDKAHATDPNLRILYSYYYDANNARQEFIQNVGEMNLRLGTVTLDMLNSDDGLTEISLDVIPISNDIAPKRNQLINIDMSKLSVYAEVDKIAVGGAARLGEYNTFKRDR